LAAAAALAAVPPALAALAATAPAVPPPTRSRLKVEMVNVRLSLLIVLLRAVGLLS